MSVSRRKGSPYWQIDIRWVGYPRLRLSTGTTRKSRAQAMDRVIGMLRQNGRRDLIGLLASNRISPSDLLAAWEKGDDGLAHLRATAESPRLGDVVDEWLEFLRHGVSTRTRRPFSEGTRKRYAISWEGFYAVLPKGRDSRLSDLTEGFIESYRLERKRAVGGTRRHELGTAVSSATLNRDLAALSSFASWARRRGHSAPTFKVVRERETRGRERWLDSTELGRFQESCPLNWWPFFAALFFTGMRLGELQGLRKADVSMGEQRRIMIHEGDRRVKTASSVRMLPIPQSLASLFSKRISSLALGPDDLLFGGDFQSYAAVRRIWDRTCEQAGISGATPHDARHTYGVHAAQSAVPIVRLQKLLGHATPQMTLRYMQHAPEAYLDADGERIADSMTAASDENSPKEAGLRLA